MSINSAKLLDPKKSKKVPLRIAKIILRVYSKINLELTNNTTTNLSFDIFNKNLRVNLLRQTLLELEKTLINMLSSDISLKILMEKKEVILTNTLYSAVNKISPNPENKRKDSYYTIKKKSMVTYTIQECCICLELFIDNLHKENSLPVSQNNIKTVTDELLEALVDTILIRMSHCIGYILIDCYPQKSTNEKYSIRQINSFRNILSREFYIERYVFRPKASYENKQLLWIISPQGLFCRYIYIKKDPEALLPIEVTNLILELLDFIAPIIGDLFSSIRKTIIFIFSKIIIEIIYIIRKAVKSFVNINR
jgi:hypothetical protein